MTTTIELSAGDRSQLRMVSRGGVFVITHAGVSPTPVRIISEGVHSRVMTAPAFSRLMQHAFIGYERGDGIGPWPLSVTEAGYRYLAATA